MNSVVNQLNSAAHKLYVKRLYRRSLKLAQDWHWRREEFRAKALTVRGLFEANRELTNLKEVERLLAYTEFVLATYQHPQPYVRNYSL